MAAMDYFRRPQLAGNTLSRLPYATLRGNVRRSDPGGPSSVAYFPAATAGENLAFSVNGNPFNVVLTSNGLTQVITDLNTAMGIAGLAFDSDGCLAIRSNTAGGTGSVEITGGTARVGLGFDPTLSSWKSVGGDLASTPEGRNGNGFGTAFPAKGENFIAETMTRALGRLSANMDVLHADLLSKEGLVQPVMSGASQATIAGPTSGLVLPASARIYNGRGQTPAASADTASFFAANFLLVDSTTNLPLRHQVTGMVDDIANTSLLEAVPQNIGTLIAITSILEGRIVKCVGADFTSAGVLVGDYAEITGATNTSPWSHNGLRWVVEKFISTDTLALRPMSTKELSVLSPSLGDTQPVLELNGTKQVGQVFGNLQVKTGVFSKNVRLTVSPPIPSGMTVKVFASQPSDLRTRQQGMVSSAPIRSYAFREPRTPSVDGILTGFTISSAGGVVSVSSGYYRFRDQVYAFPGGAVSISGTSVLFYIYLDLATGTLGFSSVPTAVLSQLSGDPLGENRLLLGTASWDGVSVDRRQASARYLAEASVEITVGSGGQFLLLDEAITFINAMALAYGESAGEVDGNCPHFDLVLVGDVDVHAQDRVSITAPSVKIRGRVPGVRLLFSGPAANSSLGLQLKDVRNFRMEDVTVWMLANSNSALIDINSGSTNIQLEGVKTDPLSPGFPSALAFTSSTGILDSFEARRCSVELSTTVSGNAALLKTMRSGGVNAGAERHVIFEDCVFDGNNDTSACAFRKDGVTDDFHVQGGLTILRCRFVDWKSSVSGKTLYGRLFGGEIRIQDCIFDNDYPSVSSSNNSMFIVESGNVVMEGCQITGQAPQVIRQSGTSHVRFINNICDVRPLNDVAVICDVAIGNHIECQDSDALNVASLLRVIRTAVGNRIEGTASAGIQTQTPGTSINGNFVSLWQFADTTCFPIQVLSSADDCTVSGNYLSAEVDGSTDLNVYPCVCLSFYGSGSVTGNVFALTDEVKAIWGGTVAKFATVSGNTIRCIQAGSTSGTAIHQLDGNWAIVGNMVFVNEPGQSWKVIDLEAAVDGTLVDGNYLAGGNDGGGATVCLGGAGRCSVIGNYLPQTGGVNLTNCFAFSSNYVDSYATGNVIGKTGDVCQVSANFLRVLNLDVRECNVVGNYFDALDIDARNSTFSSNHVSAVKTVVGGGEEAVISSNMFYCDLEVATSGATRCRILSNHIAFNVIGHVFTCGSNISYLEVRGNSIFGSSNLSPQEMLVTGNSFWDSVTLSPTNYCHFIGNWLSSTLTASGNSLDYRDNFVSGAASTQTFATSYLNISGCTFDSTNININGNVSLGYSDYVSLSNSHVFGTLNLGVTSATLTQVLMHGNRIASIDMKNCDSARMSGLHCDSFVADKTNSLLRINGSYITSYFFAPVALIDASDTSFPSVICNLNAAANNNQITHSYKNCFSSTEFTVVGFAGYGSGSLSMHGCVINGTVTLSNIPNIDVMGSKFQSGNVSVPFTNPIIDGGLDPGTWVVKKRRFIANEFIAGTLSIDSGEEIEFKDNQVRMARDNTNRLVPFVRISTGTAGAGELGGPPALSNPFPRTLDVVGNTFWCDNSLVDVPGQDGGDPLNSRGAAAILVLGNKKPTGGNDSHIVQNFSIKSNTFVFTDLRIAQTAGAVTYKTTAMELSGRPSIGMITGNMIRRPANRTANGNPLEFYALRYEAILAGTPVFWGANYVNIDGANIDAADGDLSGGNLILSNGSTTYLG